MWRQAAWGRSGVTVYRVIEVDVNNFTLRIGVLNKVAFICSSKLSVKPDTSAEYAQPEPRCTQSSCRAYVHPLGSGRLGPLIVWERGRAFGISGWFNCAYNFAEKRRSRMGALIFSAIEPRRAVKTINHCSFVSSNALVWTAKRKRRRLKLRKDDMCTSHTFFKHLWSDVQAGLDRSLNYEASGFNYQ